MKVVTPKLIETGFRIFEYRRNLALASISGDYKTYKHLIQEYSSFALQNLDVAKQVKFPEVQIPLFSRAGFNMIKISIRNLFRRKTPDEKSFIQAMRNEKIKNKYNAELQRILEEAHLRRHYNA